MSVAEEAITKEKVRINPPMECWGFTNYSRYHTNRFYTYMNCPYMMDPEIAECANHSIQEYALNN